MADPRAGPQSGVSRNDRAVPRTEPFISLAEAYPKGEINIELLFCLK
jgi:hypothetical protein